MLQGEGKDWQKMKRARGEYKKELVSFHMHQHLAIYPSLPVPLLAGQPMFVFVTLNKDQRHFATSEQLIQWAEKG
jgi:cytochrome c oxidase assembly factor CtaG